MGSKQELEDLKNDMLRRLYREAEPSLDWDDLVENPEKYEDWHPNQHVLEKERQEEIREEVMEEHGIDQEELPTSFWLDVITDKSPANKR